MNFPLAFVGRVWYDSFYSVPFIIGWDIDL